MRTADAIKALQAEWKSIGPVTRGHERAIWERFRAACDAFFTRRQDDLKQRKQDWTENLRRKEALVTEAEALAQSSEWEKAAARIKALQVEWKAIGPVKRSKSEAIWQRFRGAIDHFFARQAAYFEERNQRHGERREQLEEALARKREQAERLRDSISRDDENLERWRSNLADVHPSADDIRTNLETKIADVEGRKSEKVSRLAELDAAIRDIEAKMPPPAPAGEAEAPPEEPEPEEPEETGEKA